MYTAFPTGQRAWTSEAQTNNDARILSDGGDGVTYWSLGGYEVTVRCVTR